MLKLDCPWGSLGKESLQVKNTALVEKGLRGIYSGAIWGAIVGNLYSGYLEEQALQSKRLPEFSLLYKNNAAMNQCI